MILYLTHKSRDTLKSFPRFVSYCQNHHEIESGTGSAKNGKVSRCPSRYVIGPGIHGRFRETGRVRTFTNVSSTFLDFRVSFPLKAVKQ